MLMRGNCLDRLPDIEEESINLCITSPPYNVDLGNNKFNKKAYDIYKDKKSHRKYIKFLREVFEHVYPLLTDDGRLCINIGDGKNGQVPTIHNLTVELFDIGYKPFGHIIWNKKNTSNRAAWGSWLSPSCPSFPMSFEHILLFYKNDKKLNRRGETDLTKDEFVKFATSMWEFPGIKNKDHPAAFPIELPYRLIKMLSFIGDTVLDPFAGSGTTLVAAKKLNRKYCGIELSEQYFSLCKQNLRNCQSTWEK